ncbi:MAG: hypothetical protein IPG17_06840 [Sandaracinaceae bacterium]|nr:hypothetical protein [Sandaracinaceae bacterium]
MTDLSVRIRELEARVQHLEALRALNAETDNAIEAALRDRLPLEQTLLRVAPLLLGRTGARCAWIRTYDENLELRDFCFGVDTVPAEAADVVHAAVTSDTYRDVTVQGSVVGQRVDVAGEASAPPRCGSTGRSTTPRATWRRTSWTPGARSSTTTWPPSRSLARSSTSCGPPATR